MPSDVSAKTTLSNETLFRIANSMSLLVSVFTTLQSYHAFANPHFRAFTALIYFTPLRLPVGQCDWIRQMLGRV